MSTSNRRRRISAEEKSRLAAEWVACTRTPGHPTMEAWSKERGFSGRQIRAWVRKFQPGQRWQPEVRNAVLKAVASLTGVLETMDGPRRSVTAVESSEPVQTKPTSESIASKFTFDDEEGDQ